MTDSKKKKGPVKTSDRLLDWLKDQQYAEWQKTRTQLSFADLLDRAVFGPHPSSAGISAENRDETTQTGAEKVHSAEALYAEFAGLTDSERELLRMTLAVIRSGDRVVADALKSNIHAFSRTARPAAAETGPGPAVDPAELSNRISDLSEQTSSLAERVADLQADIARFAPREKRHGKLGRGPDQKTG
jgi:hypothetical protein